MTYSTKIIRSHRRRLAGLACAVATMAVLQACTDKLLSATDPDLVNPSDVQSSEGAEAVRLGAMERWKLTTGGSNSNGSETVWLFSGLLADEWGTASTFVQNDEADERRIKLDNSTVTNEYRFLNRVRTAVNQAVPLMRQWRQSDAQLHQKVAELFLAQAFTDLQLASDFCNGIPLSNAATADGKIVWGSPMPVAAIFDSATAWADSGLAELSTVAATDAEGIRVGNALKLTKARALLGNAKSPADYAAAAALVAGIPTSYTYQHTYAATSGSNAIWGQATSGRRYNVGDSIEGNARDIPVKNNLPFFSAKDPRVPASFTISVNKSTNKPDTTKSQDGLTLSRTTTLWGQETAVDVVNGIDARLIEAEAKFQAGDIPGMMSILNALRSADQKLGTITVKANTLPQLTDPGNDQARLALLFREKAFWTFGRGQRLGDLRRLIRQYPTYYNESNTFPEGEHYRGGTYGPDMNLPVPKDEEGNNPNFHGCIDRKA